ncbi:hypothetical protein M0R45_019840 [Rubus argutus]|uniref:Glutathione peroxidase n=1 Tax=Rubus argutus TaxID=59490 RepID=A0AAW1XA58_RUBAR
MSFKLTNWVSVFFLGFAFFYYYYTDQFSSSQTMAGESSKSIYEFTVKDIHGNDVQLSEYSGKVLLIVNVASKCGLTQSNYKELNICMKSTKTKVLRSWHFLATTEFPIFDKIEFLVNKEGKVVERYAPVTAPLKIEKDIQNLLESS